MATVSGGHRSHRKTPSRARGFTIPEVLAVMGVIALLIAVLLPALAGALRSGEMAKSQNNLKQIWTWMSLYSTENRDFIVPSRFNYSDPTVAGNPVGNYPIKVRSNAALPANERYQGTWTDILWTINGLGKQPLTTANPEQYLYDSPDKWVYENHPDFNQNPLRSAANNSRNLPGANGTPKPFGQGAQESSLAGFFAANDFFNADRNAPTPPGGTAPPTVGRWYVNGQISAPDRSMYIVDSFAGETIDPDATPNPFDNTSDDIEVDFRYNGACLMLFLDGHSSPQTPWTDLDDLQINRRIRVQKLIK